MSSSFGISGAVLKWIAVITMLIDHFAASFLNHYISVTDSFDAVYPLYTTCRYIGRIAFPIYIFLLIEGYQKTRNVKKYLGRLFLFALISEIPFDLAFSYRLFDASSQNVFFTLFFGLFALYLMDLVQIKCKEKPALVFPLRLFIIFVFLLLADLFRTDYSYVGVLAILVMYELRHKPALQMIAGCLTLCLSSLTELYALIGVLPVCFYNHERGRQMKYFFYLFYPVHLLMLWGVGMMI